LDGVKNSSKSIVLKINTNKQKNAEKLSIKTIPVSNRIVRIKGCSGFLLSLAWREAEEYYQKRQASWNACTEFIEVLCVE